MNWIKFLVVQCQLWNSNGKMIETFGRVLAAWLVGIGPIILLLMTSRHPWSPSLKIPNQQLVVFASRFLFRRDSAKKSAGWVVGLQAVSWLLAPQWIRQDCRQGLKSYCGKTRKNDRSNIDEQSLSAVNGWFVQHLAKWKVWSTVLT